MLPPRQSVPLAVVCCLFSVGCQRTPVAEPVPVPSGPMKLDEARRYVLALVNRDRAEEGLSPVEWDDTAATAGQRHAEDMTRHGFTAHWGTDGSLPEQRYSEAGGRQLPQENAACFFDGTQRELDPDPLFGAAGLEKIESAFMNELPPNDGHRTNILKPVHNKFGVGLAKPVGIDQPCMAQEFVDDYGDYDDLPANARVGQTITISGELKEPVEFGGIGIARVEPQKPLTPQHLNTTNVYQVPEPYVTYFPAGFKTPKPVQLDGRKFSIEVSLSDGKKPGRYEISVYGKYPGQADLVMVSLRTIVVK